MPIPNGQFDSSVDYVRTSSGKFQFHVTGELNYWLQMSSFEDPKPDEQIVFSMAMSAFTNGYKVRINTTGNKIRKITLLHG